MGLNLLFSLHLYLPLHGAGGEVFVHNMAKYLISKGHNCRVLLHEAHHYDITEIYTYEGVEVFPPSRDLSGHIEWADRIFTHLTFSNWTIAIARIFQKQVYFISHNTHPYECVLGAQYPVGIIYNSNAMKKALNYSEDSFVLHPPVDYRKFDLGLEPGQNKYITLINLNKNKGGLLFWEIAAAMPDKQFLGVTGSYDPQIIKELPNVTILPNTPDILSIYRQTRILLVPSEYESWGMAATEAMCNGIPVIYNPTFGLEENVGNAGIRVKRVDAPIDEIAGGDGEGIAPVRENVEKWVKAIWNLDNKQYYLRVSNRCRKRSRELDPLKELEDFEKWIT